MTVKLRHSCPEILSTLATHYLSTPVDIVARLLPRIHRAWYDVLMPHDDYPATDLDPLPVERPPSRWVMPNLFEWVCLIAGLGLLNRYAWLMDDAYIYFRYLDNLLFLGYGLVYNNGEYVEGFSSPIWVLILAPLRALHGNYWIIVRGLGCACYIWFWYSLVVLNVRMSPPKTPRVNLPLAYLGLNYGVLTYFTSGLESPLANVFAVVYALFVFNPSSVGLQLLLAVSPLVRQELVVTLGLCVVWKWWIDRQFPSFFAMMSLLANGSYVLFRIYYYADLFPNTFYLKDEVNIRQGFLYILDTALPYHFFWLAAVLALVSIWLRIRRDPDPPLHYFTDRGMMVVLALVLVAYVVKIGGDPRHFRYLAFPFCLFVCAGGGLIEHVLANTRSATRQTISIVASLGIGMASAWQYPAQLKSHPIYLRANDDVTVNNINDAHRHRTNPGGPGRMPPFSPKWNVLLMEDNLPKYAKAPKSYREIKAQSGCAIIYRDPFTYYVHSFGLTDPLLAHMEMKPDRPAHKRGLIPVAEQIVALRRGFGGTPRRGMFLEMSGRGSAPEWVDKNLASIGLLEKKMYNTHDWQENIGLAFQFTQPIQPFGAPPPPGPPRDPKDVVAE
jgi:hypothetical protein